MKLTDLPPAWSEDLLPTIREEIARSGRRVVVLDDDPTGTQTSHGVLVVTEWSEDELAGALQGSHPAIFVLTNSRSLPEAEAVTLAAEAGRNLARASKRVGVDVAIGYRGDSTLRGHYPAESWALRDAFAGEIGRPYDGEILAPFFEEGGRFTIGDTHYVQQGEDLVPAGETEFARDAAFGYRSSFLPAWVQEKSQGRVAAGVVGSVSIEDIRQGGPDRVAEILTGVSGGKVVVANSATYRDMEVFVLGLLRAEAAGRAVHLPGLGLVRAGARGHGRPAITDHRRSLPERRAQRGRDHVRGLARPTLDRAVRAGGQPAGPPGPRAEGDPLAGPRDARRRGPGDGHLAGGAVPTRSGLPWSTPAEAW